ncbi:MAG TPA: O-antigen ligase family protein, partial [Anaerolineales bacterium]|nr:O-antigen ligase family protein [Anaerolineales bacterium]
MPSLPNHFLASRWATWAELLCAIVGGILWSVNPTLTWQPLLIGLLIWIIRLFAGRFPFARTALDIPLLIFALSAAIGVWAAYDQALAVNKFWLIVGAILICRALVNQPKSNLWLITGLIGALVAFVSAHFILTHDWYASPTDLGLIDQIGQRWMLIRPPFGTGDTDTHLVGGIIVILLPVVMALGLRAWGFKHKGLRVLVVFLGVLAVCGLILAGRRAAWLSAAIVGGLWALWWVCRLAGKNRTTAFLSALTVIGLIVVVSVMAFPAQILRLTAFSNRTEGIKDALRLLADFFWTGGGLRSFAGLYSRYILVIPWLYTP